MKRKERNHVKILRYVFSVLTLMLVVYELVTEIFSFSHIMMLFLGLTMLMRGLEEFKQGRKGYGWLFVVVFLLSLSVSIEGFIYVLV
ncbi:YczI family protein [Halobacillus rhizosphaerae]|uniref:YczI family protein n=1 Tax=Halobacillus rhizosphaerae TaxID=3064889 RepID=UPI00398BA341